MISAASCSAASFFLWYSANKELASSFKSIASLNSFFTLSICSSSNFAIIDGAFK
jgi:hypothetical protein